MTILDNQPARSGNTVNSEAEVENVVDILSQISTATPITYNEQAAQEILNRTTPVTGNMVASDGTVYNIVDLLKGISAGSDVLKYKGSVATYADLPNDAEVGDVYNVLDTGKNYAWDGTTWDDFGGAVTVALSACTDVNLTNPVTGQALVYDSTTQKWVNTDLKTYKNFDASWTTNTSLQDFLDDVYDDTNASVGNVYLGSLTCSDLPTGLNNVEAVIEILPSTVATKVIHITITSGNLEPYHWEYTYWEANNQSYNSGWVSFITNYSKIVQKADTLPTASSGHLGEVYMYTGTDGTYKHGYFYECQETSTNVYEWVNLEVQPLPQVTQDPVQGNTLVFG